MVEPKIAPKFNESEENKSEVNEETAESFTSWKMNMLDAMSMEPFSQASDRGTPIEAIIQKPIFSLIKKMEVVECDS